MKHLNHFSPNSWKTEFYSILEKNIQLGDNLSKKLSKMNDPLADKMLDFLTSDRIKDDANVSKIDYNKDDEKLLTLYDEKGKPRKFKFGKLLSYLGYDTKNIKPYEVENFINQFKKGNTERLKEVKGKDILASYNCKNYLDISTSYDRGGLGVSCMRFDYAQEYLEIYTANPNQVSCLTLYTEEGDKVQGRALIWTLDDGERFMDRIYAYEKDDYVHFYSYAEEHNIKRDKDQMFVELDNGGEYDTYPYMDTFEYYLPERNLLTNYDPTEYGGDDYEGEPIYQLLNTNGTADLLGEGGEMVESEYMGERIRKDEAVHSDYMDDWIYEHEAVQLFRGLDKSPDWVMPRYEGVVELSYMSDDYEAGEGNMPDEPYALIDDCVMVKQKEGSNIKQWILKEDTDAYVEIDGDYYVNYDEIYISKHDKKDTFKMASKDSWDEYHPLSELISIWSDEDRDMMKVNYKNKSEKLKRIEKNNNNGKGYSDYVSIDNSCNDTEKCYVPKEFFTREEHTDIEYIKPDAPLLYAKQFGEGRLISKKRIEENGVVEIQQGYFSHEKYSKEYGVESNDGIKIYPPLLLNYFNGMTYDEKDIPMIASFNNKYKSYEDYKKRMKELYVFFKDYKNKYDETYEFYEEKMNHMNWALTDYYYFEKAFDYGTKLESYLMEKYEQKTDAIFLTYEKESTILLEKFLKEDEREMNFTATSIHGTKMSYGEGERIFDLDKQSNIYISFMGMYYDTPKYKVFPYFYADKIDKYVVYKKDTESKFGGYEMMSLEEIKGL